MSISIGNYNYIHSYHEGKKGYVNKFEKSLKMPFLKVLHNHLPSIMPANKDDLKLDESEIKVSDNVELSSAVTGASDIGASEHGGSDIGGTGSGSAT